MFRRNPRRTEPSRSFQLSAEELAQSDEIGVVRTLALRALANSSPEDSAFFTQQEWQELRPLLEAVDMYGAGRGYLTEGSYDSDHRPRQINSTLGLIIEHDLRVPCPFPRPYRRAIYWRPLDLVLLSPSGAIDQLEFADYETVNNRRLSEWTERDLDRNVVRTFRPGTLRIVNPNSRSQVVLELAGCFLSLDQSKRQDLCELVREITCKDSPVERDYVRRYAQLAIDEMAHELLRAHQENAAVRIKDCVDLLASSKAEVRSAKVGKARSLLEMLLTELRQQR